jgi:hypothetical protein
MSGDVGRGVERYQQKTNTWRWALLTPPKTKDVLRCLEAGQCVSMLAQLIQLVTRR